MKPIWKQLPVEKGHREELAALTGIAANDLSALNTGKRAMTIHMARRIANAVEGVSVLDLGAREEVAPEEATLIADRLQALEDTAARAEDLARIDRVLRAAILALASGDAAEAQRVLSAEAQ